MKILINKNPAGWVNNLEFAFCQFVDGCIRLFSLGLLFTDLPLAQTRKTARKSIEKSKSIG